MQELILNPHAIAVLALTLVAFVVFTIDRIPIPVTALAVIACLALGFHLFPYEQGGIELGPQQIFSGFGHEALISICCLMILGRALMVTGALEPLARLLARLWAFNRSVALLVLLASAMFLSAFINDTPVVVVLMPVAIGLAMRAGQSASRMLMPMNFAVIIGGMATTIGTSTNLLIVSLARDHGVPPIDMFEFTPLVIGPALLALAYLWLVAPRLLADHVNPLAGIAPRRFDAILYVGPRSRARGKTVSRARRWTGNKMTVQRVQRGAETLTPTETLVLLEGDRLLVNDTSAYLKEYEQALGATLYDADTVDNLPPEQHPLRGQDQRMVEVVITEESPLHKRNLREMRFAERYGVVILAMYRPSDEESLTGEILDRELRSGDVLLVQGSPERTTALKSEAGLLVLDGTLDLPRTRKAPLAVLVMAAVVLLAAFRVLPISMASLIGVVALLVTGSLKFEGLGRGISAEVVLIVVASLSLGRALTATGGAEILASGFMAVASGLSTQAMLAAVMIFLGILTNFVSNNAAAAVGTPVALAIAQQMGAPPEPFVLAAIVGCNLSFATPMGYQTNVLIMQPGGYVFRDFVRVGGPLVILMIIAFSIELTAAYPI
ncbi:MAG: SLC13 family permease [Steroidobacteraceae bacterium]|nr:SLC13 family permease [Steroidobacteraceae bacterium]